MVKKIALHPNCNMSRVCVYNIYVYIYIYIYMYVCIIFFLWANQNCETFKNPCYCDSSCAKRPVDSPSFEEVVIKLLHFQRSHIIVPMIPRWLVPLWASNSFEASAKITLVQEFAVLSSRKKRGHSLLLLLLSLLF